MHARVRTHALPVAPSDSEGKKILCIFTPTKNAGRHSLLPIHAIAGPRVRSMLLDLLLSAEELDGRDARFATIDVEGSELLVFRGMSAILQECPLILAKFSPEYMKRGWLKPSELITPLEGRGFRPHLLAYGQLMETNGAILLAATRNLNVLWVKAWPEPRRGMGVCARVNLGRSSTRLAHLKKT